MVQFRIIGKLVSVVLSIARELCRSPVQSILVAISVHETADFRQKW